jgi:hypothetical protein
MQNELIEKLERALEFDEKETGKVAGLYDASYSFLSGAHFENARLKPIHLKLIECVRALDWALEEICEHRDAFKQLEEHPRMDRAFCTCSNWVYRGYKNEVRDALQALAKELEK